MSGFLKDLEIDGLERSDSQELDCSASFVAPDGIHVSVFDVQDADNRNAYWIRGFGGDPKDNECLVNGHISEGINPEKEDVVEMVQEAIIVARVEMGQSISDAKSGLEAL